MMVRRAFSDPLTGLLSRAAFDHRVERSLASSSGWHDIGVLYVDVDDFHGLNERFGAAAGDLALIAVADRLTETLRPGDSMARLGADEYAVLLEDTTEEAAVAVATRILDAIRCPLRIQDHDLALTASAGIALNGSGEGRQEIARNAEDALTTAKETGGDRHVVHERGASRPARRRPRSSSTVPRTDALQDRLTQLLLMQEAAVATNEADDLHDAAQVVMQRVRAPTGCAISRFWVPAPNTQQDGSPALWDLAGSSGQDPFSEAGERPSFGEGVCLPDRVLATGRPIWIPNLAAESDPLGREDGWAASPKSAFAFPVLVGREVVAVLEFFSNRTIEPTGSSLDLLAGIGSQLGRVVERQRAAEALQRLEEQLRTSEARLRKAEAMAGRDSWHALRVSRDCSREVRESHVSDFRPHWGDGLSD